MLKIQSDKEFKEIISNNEFILIYFSATWCGPCKFFAPIFELASNQNKNITFAKIDIDEVQKVAIDYGIMSVPTIIGLHNGQEIERSIGAPQNLQNWINNFIIECET